MPPSHCPSLPLLFVGMPVADTDLFGDGSYVERAIMSVRRRSIEVIGPLKVPNAIALIARFVNCVCTVICGCPHYELVSMACLLTRQKQALFGSTQLARLEECENTALHPRSASGSEKDCIAQANCDFAYTRLGFMKLQSLHLSGCSLACLGRYPVFIQDVDEDEDWDNPFGMQKPTTCPQNLCYNTETREKFWGFVGALYYADSMTQGTDARLERLKNDGYRVRYRA